MAVIAPDENFIVIISDPLPRRVLVPYFVTMAGRCGCTLSVGARARADLVEDNVLRRASAKRHHDLRDELSFVLK